MNNRSLTLFYLGMAISVSLFATACSDSFLDHKYRANTVIPSSIEDYQALLDNTTLINNREAHVLGIVSADEFSIRDDVFNSSRDIAEKNAYIWADEIYENTMPYDWNFGYRRVLYANVVLDGLAKIERTPNNMDVWNLTYGRALFLRGYSLLNLAQLFCLPYRSETSLKDLGLPLRLTSDIEAVVPRSNLYDTFEQIVNDLEGAVDHLTDLPDVFTKPSRTMAYLVLSRCFLQMGKFDRALVYAEKALELKDVLLDYNTLVLDAAYPFTVNGKDNPEIIYYEQSRPSSLGSETALDIDPVLYASYEDGDLRKALFWHVGTQGNTYFKGSYTGSYILFSGATTAETYLTLAECRARAGELEGARKLLNTLLEKRYRAGDFVPISETDGSELLGRIVMERRKELVLRGIRWWDIKRFNKETERTITLSRSVNGKVYTLPPNDQRFALPIPEDAVKIGGLEPNPR